MAIERTFSIIKPDAVAKNAIGAVTAKLEGAGLRILASKMVRLTETQAKAILASVLADWKTPPTDQSSHGTLSRSA